MSRGYGPVKHRIVTKMLLQYRIELPANIICKNPCFVVAGSCSRVSLYYKEGFKVSLLHSYHQLRVEASQMAIESATLIDLYPFPYVMQKYFKKRCHISGISGDI